MKTYASDRRGINPQPQFAMDLRIAGDEDPQSLAASIGRHTLPPNELAPTNVGGYSAAGRVTRRRFLGSALVATASASVLRRLQGRATEVTDTSTKPAEFQRKIKLGVIGC